MNNCVFIYFGKTFPNHNKNIFTILFKEINAKLFKKGTDEISVCRTSHSKRGQRGWQRTKCIWRDGIRSPTLLWLGTTFLGGKNWLNPSIYSLYPDMKCSLWRRKCGLEGPTVSNEYFELFLFRRFTTENSDFFKRIRY